jgi:tetratricopeptide (TPR) repeat protein
MVDDAPREIVPFWERLGDILRYPLQPAPLMTIVVLAICHFASAVPFGFVLDLLVWVALYTYAFECLRASADGNAVAPEIAITVDDSLGRKMLIVIVVFVLFNVAAHLWLGAVGATIASLVLALALPGAIMSLAMDEDVFQALNPATWIAILSRIGGAYVAVAAIILVFGIGQRFVARLELPFPLGFASELAFYLVAHYFTIAAFHLMGYLIWQYQDAVGYTPTPRATLSHTANDPDRGLRDEAARLVADGKAADAADLLGVEIRGRGGSEALHVQYRKLLSTLDRRDESIRHARDWITALLALGNDRRAVDVAREALELDPQFEPAEPDNVARLVDAALAKGATQVALALATNARASHPNHRDVPRNALAAAKILAERMGRDDEARTLLDDVAARFPDDPLADDIATYRAFLARIAAGAKPA